MIITVNDKEQTLNERCTVRQLLEQHGFARSPCAVEVNRQVVPKGKHNDHLLADGDRIEIVTLVGGG